MEDCVGYCDMEGVFSTNDNPRCRTAGVLNCTKGTGICHREDIHSVRGFAVANTDPLHPTRFDPLLVFTGKATSDDAESGCRSPEPVFFLRNSVSALSNQPFAVDFVTKYSTHGLDIGSDHAWVNDTSLYVWILCFRIGGLGGMVWMVILITRGSTTRFVREFWGSALDTSACT